MPAVTLAFPRDINELVQKLDHNYVAYFDNISGIKEWISDQLCRSVTGSGFSKRQLFTDDQDIVYSFKRALGFNGINLAATKADLLDRCLIILLERIKDELRRPLEDIVNIKGMDRALEKIKPQLLGYIFDMVAKLLKVISMKGITKPKELPRMADFAIHGEIVARCIGYDKGVFLKAFNENTKLQSAELIESNPLAMTVFQFVQWKPQFKGTATKLLEELNLKAAELGIQQDKFWPKSPGALSRKLNLIRTSLRRVGVDIEFYEHTGISGKSRGIKICKISSDASEASVASDIPVNQARIDAIGSDDISDDIKDKNKVSSEKRGKSTRKKHFSDDTDDTDDILHTSGGSEHTYDYEKYVEEQKERIKNITDEESNSAITSKAYWSQNSGYWHYKTPKCRFTGDKFAIMKHSHENVGTKF